MIIVHTEDICVGTDQPASVHLALQHRVSPGVGHVGVQILVAGLDILHIG